MNTTKKMLFIYNPRSGKAQLKNKLSDILDIFVKGGYEVTVHPTQAKFDAKNVARENAPYYDIIACSGGDGTIDEVVDGLMGAHIRPNIGYIPTGTVNDFASSLHLSKNIITAAQDIVYGEAFSCDIGSFNKEHFTYVAAFGLFSDVAYQTPQESKNILGRQAYIIEGMKRLASIKPYKLRFEHDSEVIEDEFVYGMITNATSIGGFEGLGGKDVSLDDGMFEVTLIKMPKNPLDLQAIVNALLKQEPNPTHMYSFRTSSLHITSSDPVEWTLDGEFGGSETDVHISAHQKAVQIIVAADKITS